MRSWAWQLIRVCDGGIQLLDASSEHSGRDRWQGSHGEVQDATVIERVRTA
ncbi:hypothetical protein [Micromonospora sp. 4G55]|uniref:hypothetical protein n=1 Tax=Micromonospora sp. 4G55 TaxID=2806102 RepID=UPI001A54B2A5|nr:hypothetical protein [Micromonospora sp. 4G55]MBM0259833.1 hypothetical protein [Micromonospora sp. 4G55]